MGADLFESYAGSIIAPIALAAFLPGIVVNQHFQDELGGLIVPAMFLFPLAIAAVGMVASIIGAFMVKSSGSTSVHDLGKALHRSPNTAAFITVAGVPAPPSFMPEDTEIVAERGAPPTAAPRGLLAASA